MTFQHFGDARGRSSRTQAEKKEERPVALATTTTTTTGTVTSEYKLADTYAMTTCRLLAPCFLSSLANSRHNRPRQCEDSNPVELHTTFGEHTTTMATIGGDRPRCERGPFASSERDQAARKDVTRANITGRGTSARASLVGHGIVWWLCYPLVRFHAYTHRPARGAHTAGGATNAMTMPHERTTTGQSGLCQRREEERRTVGEKERERESGQASLRLSGLVGARGTRAGTLASA